MVVSFSAWALGSSDRPHVSAEVVLDVTFLDYSLARRLSFARPLFSQVRVFAAFLRCVFQRIRSRRLDS